MTDDLEARVILSEMTEITGRTIDQVFHRDPDLDALYRDVPSAFWLAPDADLTIPPPRAAPARHILVGPDRPPSREALPTVDGRGKATTAALLAAGPTFAAMWLAFNGGVPGEAWWQPFGRIATSLMLLPFTVIVGATLGLIPILFGTFLLGEGGAHRRWLQRPGAWIGIGAVLGTIIAALVDARGSTGLCLVATSMLCAGIARHMVTWRDPEFA